MELEYEQERTEALSEEEIAKIVYLLEHSVPAQDIADRYHTELWVIQTLSRLCEEVSSFK